MADSEHLAKLREGPEAWNRWMGQHLLDVVLGEGVAAYVKRGGKPDLNGADISGANLRQANVKQAIITRAFLRNADLH